MDVNKTSLDCICASFCEIMGIEAPKKAAPSNDILTRYSKEIFAGKNADRIFVFNPDAIGEWVYEKYKHLMSEVVDKTDVKFPLCSVMPSVTPVCFATMYTGTQPQIHGIQSYIKPVLKIETIFDVLIKSGKKCAIVSTENDSISMLFLERQMDYYIYPTTEQVNAKAAELIIKDEYDFIVVYNAKYDATMHKYGPESVEALAELRSNVEQFALFNEMIKEHWSAHNVLVGFATDHGCHEIDGRCGSHGLDMVEDLNIVHFYKAYSPNYLKINNTD